jgi:RND superfamily putative drug exporter
MARRDPAGLEAPTADAEDGLPTRGTGARWKRALLPGAVLLVTLFVVAPVAGTLSGKLTSVTENDQAAFLPDSAESTRSLALETRFAGAQDIPALIVWERQGGLDDADLASVDDAVSRVNEVDGVAGPASEPIPSEDG